MANERPKGLWVHRLSADSGGAPLGAVSLEDVQDELGEVCRRILHEPAERLPSDHKAEQQFVNSELLHRGVLRQGWGVPGLDLRSKSDFRRNYVVARRKYWSDISDAELADLRGRSVWDDRAELFGRMQVHFRAAAGRYQILLRMMKMNRGDVVFVPNVPEPGKSFAVARIADAGYVFEERTSPASMSWQRDFGHLRRVTDVRTFEYGDSTLTRAAFGPPYRHAIDAVSARRAVFEEFLQTHYS